MGTGDLDLKLNTVSTNCLTLSKLPNIGEFRCLQENGGDINYLKINNESAQYCFTCKVMLGEWVDMWIEKFHPRDKGKSIREAWGRETWQPHLVTKTSEAFLREVNISCGFWKKTRSSESAIELVIPCFYLIEIYFLLPKCYAQQKSL